MSPLTTLRLAVAGSRSDTVRIVLTAVSAALGTVALLASVTVLAVPGGQSDRYTNELLNEPGLRPGVALALMLLTVPVLAFVAQCGRLGAPARERRLAAIRLAGATPGQVIRIAVVETGLASALGVGLGFGAYFLVRALIDAPDASGLRPLPTDVVPHGVAMVVVAAVVPVFVMLLAVLALRRVVVTPFGVVRGTRRGRPGIAPGVAIILGVGLCASAEPLGRAKAVPDTVVEVAVLLGVVAVSIGIVTGTGWITYVLGRLLRRYARRPVGLLAGTRMMADPWAGTRTLAAMLIALLIGTISAVLGAQTVSSYHADDENNRRMSELMHEAPYPPMDTSFYDRAYQLVGYAVLVGVVIAAAGLLVALADGIVARRRTLVSLIAAGTPRGVLARALGWQVLAPVVPAVALAVAIGIILPRRVLRDPVVRDLALRCAPVDACQASEYREAHGVVVVTGQTVYSVPVPWHQLALLGGGAVAATVVITLVGLLFLRMSTRVTDLRTT